MPGIGKVFRGFSLIELLVVIAILGTIIALVVAAIDPIEKVAIANDTIRKKDIVTIGRALSRYRISTDITANPAPADLELALVDSGEIKVFPKNPSEDLYPCNSPAQLINGYCYNTTTGLNNTGAIYVPLVSKRDTEICPEGYITWYTWLTAAGRPDIICDTIEPDPSLTDFPEIPTGSPVPTPLPTPTPTDTPLPPTPLPTPTPTDTPLPPTPSPSPTPTPINYCIPRSGGSSCTATCTGAGYAGCTLEYSGAGCTGSTVACSQKTQPYCLCN